MNIYKKSISLIEILFILIISSVLLLSISNITLNINQKNNNDYLKNILKIEFESTRLFLQKKITIDKNLSNLSYLNKTLYYNNNILVKNVESFLKTNSNDIIILNICLKNKIQLCQDIRIKNGI